MWSKQTALASPAKSRAVASAIHFSSMHSSARLLLGLAIAAVSVSSTLLGADIKPNDPSLRYVGRFDTRDAAGPKCSWPNSTVAFTVSGGSVDVKLNETNKSYWQVVIDGKPTSVLALKPDEDTYSVAADLTPGNHTIELVKRTESSQGITQILGLRIDDNARLVPTPARPHRIEVIGDSITCGFGNEAANKEEKFTAATENAWLSYGAVAARAVDADYVAIAASGKKLHPDNTIVSLYDRVLANSATPKWDFISWVPDAVVINLGTNDFAKANPEETTWIAAYVDFINQIRARYPKAAIYCTLGPMISNWPGDRKPRTVLLGHFEKIVAQANAAGGVPVHFIDFGTQAQHHGIGAQWHPSVKTHSLMADKLVEAFKRDLGW